MPGAAWYMFVAQATLSLGTFHTRRRCRLPRQLHRRAEGVVGAQHLLRLEADPCPLAAQARDQRGVIGLTRFGDFDAHIRLYRK